MDDVQGRTHQVYGALPDPSYLVDSEGRIAYYNLWTHAPTLRKAMDALLAQGGVGVVNEGLSRGMPLGAAFTDGWRGIARGLPQSFNDLMLAAPGVPIDIWLGYQLRPVLAPWTLRDKPLPMPVKAALIAGGATAALLGARWIRNSGRGR